MRRRRRSLEEQRDAWTSGLQFNSRITDKLGYPREIAYLHIGTHPTTIPPIREDSYSVTLCPGDTLTWTAGGPDAEREVYEHMKPYSDIVPVGSERGLAWIAREERERAERARVRRENERMAEAWLAERNVPDYVVEYLRDPVFEQGEEIP